MARRNARLVPALLTMMSHPPKLGHRLIERGLDGCSVGDVARQREDAGGVAASGCSKRRDGGFELVGVACGDRDVSTVFDEALGDAESDAAVTAGYECGFV